MKRWFWWTLAMMLTVPVACKKEAPKAEKPAAVEGGPVARVNGKEIPRAAFDAEMNKITQGGTRQIPEDRLRKIQENVVNRLVEEELLAQEIQRQGIQVTEAEIDAEFEKYRGRFKSEEQFNSYLTHGKTTIEEIRARLRSSLALTKLLQKLGRLDVPEEEVRQAYQTGIKMYTEPEQVQARHILIKVAENAPADQVEAARKKAMEALKKVRGGEDFGNVARTHSDDAMSKEKGGDLGFFRRGVMVPKFEEAAFAMQPGEMSKEPVRTPFGFHIIQVTDRKAERVKPFEEVQDQIRESLRNRNTFKARRELVEQLRKDGKVEILIPGLDQPAPAPAAAPAPAPVPAAAPAPAPAVQPAPPPAQ
ncbi:peptidylprolyl isomerase [Myxococcota bacterium]|nr:peptidylprolyl isomerase [Myxococcota bacterium]